ncbi:three-Cys-motif partner protein TcmP [Aestuariispira ectoiniformans]|uniref:three-Cys-motif partner protein TcmP n=1 Tax=Aestuariispira ectoiniformans TaxID=2775080 RepID=UPI00223B2B24|nr:three-Cys-motif partner protein TcmP [Aestuariispira ectoiniformans]
MAKKKEKYNWGDKPPVDPHTKIKHKIIHDYVKQYVLTLSKPRTADEFKTSIFDCFSGGGIYKDGDSDHMGSPFQILEAVREAENEIREQDRHKDLLIDVNYFFSDIKPEAIESLKGHFRDRSYDTLLDRCRVATCSEIVDELISSAKKHTPRAGKALFILDQYGYSDATVYDIVKIFTELKKAEVLLFLSVDKIVDFLNPSDAFRKSLDIAGYDLPIDELVSKRNESNLIPVYQYECRKYLLQSYLSKLGQIYIHPFSIKSYTDGREYWFAHITRSWKAREVMLGVHRSYATHSVLYGVEGLDLMMLGYAPRHSYVDDLIKENTVEALDRRLPEHLAESLLKYITDNQLFGLSVEELMLRTANGNPADKRGMEKTFDLLMSTDVVFKSPDGAIRRSGRSVQHTDLLHHTGQRRFIF